MPNPVCAHDGAEMDLVAPDFFRCSRCGDSRHPTHEDLRARREAAEAAHTPAPAPTPDAPPTLAEIAIKALREIAQEQWCGSYVCKCPDRARGALDSLAGL